LTSAAALIRKAGGADVLCPDVCDFVGVSLLVGQWPAYRVLMVWVYDRTGSLLVAMLMHARLSACTVRASRRHARCRIFVMMH
jgi:hypothetical protein